MKKSNRFLALLLAVLMLLSVLSACGKSGEPSAEEPSESPTPAPVLPAETPEPVEDTSWMDEVSTKTLSVADVTLPDYNGGDTLVVGYSNFSGRFSPFFASSAYDNDVSEMTQIPLLDSDRTGNILMNGIEGDVIDYNGVEYTYRGAADCHVTENDDGTVTYAFTLRDDIYFSDGVNLTADDCIFSFYVCADPTYDGVSTFYALPVVGMADYRSGMSALSAVILADGPDAVGEAYTAEQAETFWAAFDAAGVRFVQEIVDYCSADFAADYAQPVTGHTAAQLQDEPGLQVALGMWAWAYADGLGDDGLFHDVAGNSYDLQETFPTVEDFWQLMVATYGNDVSDDGINLESAGSSISALISEELGDRAGEFAAGVSTGDSADSIAGIVKTGMYSFEITTESFDATTIYNLAIPIAPLHYYGSREDYCYSESRFGFTKGDLSDVKDRTSSPMGAGPYRFVSYENGVVSFERNELYYLGCPNITYVSFQEASDADKLTGLASGSLDISDPAVSDSVVASIKEYNENGELSGDVISTVGVDLTGYGYIGIQADNVRVGSDSGSEASKNLRRAFATLFAVYRGSVVESYFGERASVIEYPISSTSWAAPRPADEGYRTAYSTDAEGKTIYTDGMTEDERYDAALTAAVGFLKAAGYTWDEAKGEFTAAPEGAKLAYEIMLPANGVGAHPAYGMATAASAALATVGIDLQVTDVANSDAMWESVYAASAEMWAGAWEATVDPDMYQVYYGDNAVGRGGTDTNYACIVDEQLNELILAARASADNSYRKATYRQCLDIVLDWSVEVPLYQRQNIVLFSAERVKLTTLTPDQTPYWSWMRGLSLLELN